MSKVAAEAALDAGVATTESDVNSTVDNGNSEPVNPESTDEVANEGETKPYSIDDLLASSANEPAESYESKPPGGSGHILSGSQIRYCLAELARIDGARKILDGAEDAQVDRFNLLVNDWNYRCSDFKYRDGTLGIIQAEIAGRRLELEAEGASRFR
ncbi:MAG TPA: hypothetical protein VJL35_05430 [Gemmatimonadaceae bacterium]|nr:hypothetical protein [Gemmatimonadaceae bacterium]